MQKRWENLNLMKKRFNEYIKLIVVKHVIFSLIAALTAMVEVRDSLPAPYVIIWLLIGGIGAIVGGNAISKVSDMGIENRDLVKHNGELSKGIINKQEGLIFAAMGFSIIILSGQMISNLALIFSPVAIVLLIVNAYSERFTWACHFILGIVSSSAPIAVSIAITGGISKIVIFIGIANFLWVSASDIIYSIKKYDFNIKNGIYSIPTSFGVGISIKIALLLYFMAIIMIIYIGEISSKLGIIYYLCVIGIIIKYYRDYRSIIVNKR